MTELRKWWSHLLLLFWSTEKSVACVLLLLILMLQSFPLFLQLLSVINSLFGEIIFLYQFNIWILYLQGTLWIISHWSFVFNYAFDKRYHTVSCWTQEILFSLKTGMLFSSWHLMQRQEHRWNWTHPGWKSTGTRNMMGSIKYHNEFVLHSLWLLHI